MLPALLVGVERILVLTAPSSGPAPPIDPRSVAEAARLSAEAVLRGSPPVEVADTGHPLLTDGGSLVLVLTLSAGPAQGGQRPAAVLATPWRNGLASGDLPLFPEPALVVMHGDDDDDGSPAVLDAVARSVAAAVRPLAGVT